MGKRHAAAAVVIGAIGLLAAMLAPANADVGITQQAVMVGDKPVSGRYSYSFNNYHEKIVRCRDTSTLPEGTVCTQIGWRVARGTMSTKLISYKIKEGIRGYDYYLLDADINVVNHSGSSDEGWAKVTVRTSNATLVDRKDTNSVRADGNSCKSISLTMSTPWPVVSAAVDLGHVTFCDDAASFNRTTSGNPSVWTASRKLAHINALTVNRAVKVKRGERPVFTVTVEVPRDDCTAAKDGLCTKYTNLSGKATYKVGTSG